MKLLLATVALALGVGLSGAAHATNLLVNGDFETPDLVGWSVNGVQTFHVIGMSGKAWLGSVGGDGRFYQSVATTVGQHYTFSFDMQNFDGATPDDFSAFVGSLLSPTTLFSVADTGPSDWAHFSFDFAATDIATVIGFTGRNDHGFYFVDNASVVAATPIPAALPLFASAIGGLGFVGWRRRRAAATAAG